MDIRGHIIAVLSGESDLPAAARCTNRADANHVSIDFATALIADRDGDHVFGRLTAG